MAAVLPNGDYVAPSTKRVSYILPPVRHAPRLFQLPTLEANVGNARGRTGPLLISSGLDGPIRRKPSRQNDDAEEVVSSGSSSSSHPRHTLPVSSLALDTSTILGGNQERKPTGILYTGGRDGMIGAWELGLRMKKRKISNHRYNMREEDEEGADDDEDEQTLAGDRAGPGIGSHQSEWEVDDSSDEVATTPAATFRQCIGSHTDWINDIVLCNQNQTGEYPCQQRYKRRDPENIKRWY
jgi:WD repeat-containing protein 48